jgi:phage major head subunit gpT-like protein
MVISNAAFKFMTDLDPVLSEVFFQRYTELQPMLLGPVWGVRESTKASENSMRVGSFGDPQPWQGQVHYDTPDIDYPVSWSHTTYTLGFKVTKEFIEDNQYSEIFTSAANLGRSFNRKVLKDEASVFNNAFATVGYDGKVLVATDHPRSKTDSTATSNSMGTVALTDANLEAAIVKLEELGDDRGDATGAMATHLVVGRQLRATAIKLTGSTLEPESGNNAVNTHTSIIPVVHPMISGKKWYVIDASMAQQSLLWYWRVRPEFAAAEDESSTLIRSFYGRMRYSMGWQDFRWIVGSNAS